MTRDLPANLDRNACAALDAEDALAEFRDRFLDDGATIYLDGNSMGRLPKAAVTRLHEMAERWEERYPGVDIVLIEPEPTDELMFTTSMMNFTSRVEIARHGFQSVTKHLAGEYDHYREICERHGIDISEKRVKKVVEHFEVEQEEMSAWRKILEGTTGALLRQAGSAG